MERDLFGRLLLVALNNTLELEKVLTYPLTPIPLSLCHIEGTIRKTNKSALLKALQENISSDEPTKADVLIFDGFFMLYLMKDVPVTFGKIADKFLRMICNNKAKTVYIVFDQYVSPSIKDYERSLRGTIKDRPFVISGPDVKRVNSLSTDLKNANFKQSLVNFFIDYWAKDHHKEFIGNKTLYVDFGECHKFQILNDTVQKTIQPEFSCPHQEEADTRIIFHVAQLQDECDVTIRCSDTDILIILLGNMAHIDRRLKINLQVGSGNNQSHINVTHLYNTLGPTVANSLPAFHAFTGCDYNPTFYGKGKNRPLQILTNSPKFMQAFIDLTNEYPNCNESVFKTIEEFVCRMYNITNTTSVNEARLNAFYKAYQLKKKIQFTKSNMRNFDSSSLPPCSSELQPHIRRTAYIAKLWTNAYSQSQVDLDVSTCGWNLSNDGNELQFSWFDGEQLPASISDITEIRDEEKGKVERLILIDLIFPKGYFIFLTECEDRIEVEDYSSDDDDDDEDDDNFPSY